MKISQATLAIFFVTIFFVTPLLAADSVAELQSRFDREPNAVRKAKLLEKLGEAQFAAVATATKAGDNSTIGLTFEKYRDNVRAALDALKKQHPDAEKQSNGYRQIEVSVRKAIREVDESLVVAPTEYRPPLELVRRDLVNMDDEVLRALFPRRPGEQPSTPPDPAPTSPPPQASDKQP